MSEDLFEEPVSPHNNFLESPKLQPKEKSATEDDVSHGKFGDWRTVQKLNIVEKYAVLYSKVLSSNFRPIKHYIDAFAGEGNQYVQGQPDLIEGSVTRVARLGFDHFHFVEIEEEKCDKLRRVVRAIGVENKSDIHTEDANTALPRIVNNLHQSRLSRSRGERALIFIDPFGMQFKWETLVKISKAPSYYDIVYLFPCHSILRSMPKKIYGQLKSNMKDRVCACLGMTESEIIEEFYSEPNQMQLFGDLLLVRDADYDAVERVVLKRMNSIFKYVFEEPKKLQIEKRPTLHSIFLMATNPSEGARKAIKRLGEHVFQ